MMNTQERIDHVKEHHADTGDCFDAAYKWIVRYGNSSSRLVHAEVAGQGELDGVTFGHAYVIHDGFAYDNTNGRNLCLPVGLYESVGRIREIGNVKEYTMKQAMKLANVSGHSGPWEFESSTGL